MKQRIVTAVAALLCAFTLFSAGIAPAHAYAPPSGEDVVSPQAEEIVVFYRNNNGVDEMRVWSLTRGIWLTDWVPIPDNWNGPNRP